ncbi:uncharacterized protein LOC135688385 [Rhopilema esculentum]|uniref:uncharacterized protein LOC135688385 n=1 Tax=Rhopilema esculentum TaxID=499914 RepID=UPI0031D7D4AB
MGCFQFIWLFMAFKCSVFRLAASQVNKNQMSPLIQTGPGAVKYLRSGTSSQYLYRVSNTDFFGYKKSDEPSHNQVEILAYFLPKDTGQHVFTGTFSKSSSFSIYANHTTKASTTSTSPSLSLYLRADFRYKIEMLLPSTNFARIGVTFPNGSICDPIDNRSLHRNIDLYDRNFLLRHDYDRAGVDQNVSSFFDNFISTMPFEPLDYFYTNYISSGESDKATLYSGLVIPPYTSNYSFELSCQVSCKFQLSLGAESVLLLTGNGVTPVGVLDRSSFCIRVWLIGAGSLKINRYDKYEQFISTVTFSSNVLPSAQTSYTILTPQLAVHNATALSVSLSSGTRLSHADRWTPITNYEILCFDDTRTVLIETFHIATSLTQNRLLVGLNNYTYYECFANHFGTINGITRDSDPAIKRNYSFQSSYSRYRTGENVPSAEPRNLRGERPGLGQIRIEWDAIPVENHEGSLTYKIYYRKKSDSPDWTSTTRTYLYHTFRSLELEFYQFKVCGITGAGEGPCSQVIEMRPLARINQIERERNSFSFETNMLLTNKALVGHVLAKYSVRSVEECFRKCSTCLNSGVCKCASFNVEHIRIGYTSVCELNAASSESRPKDLLERVGYQHFRVSLVSVQDAV